MADAPAWAEEARTAAAAALDAMPELTGTEEEWRFTPPGDIGMAGAEPSGASAGGDVALPDATGRAARLVFADGNPQARVMFVGGHAAYDDYRRFETSARVVP